jgi:hypothetical protein
MKMNRDRTPAHRVLSTMEPGEAPRKDGSDRGPDFFVPNHHPKAPSAFLDGHDLGNCDRLFRHGPLCLSMDGRVPGTILIIQEVAMKTWLLSTLFLLAITASFARAAEFNDSFMAYAVFYVR